MARSALPSVVANLVGAALIGALIAPAQGANAATDPATPVLGGFAIGDGAEATISEADGALALVLPLGGLGLGWDSRQAGTDRHGLGAGWAWHSAWVDTSGGVRVFPASGGTYAADASQASGLAGYPAQDVRFEATAGVLPARADTATGARDYAYRLHELGGRTTWFDDDGDALATADASGTRTDLVWDDEVPHRLREVVTGEGLVTWLEWSAESLTVHPGRSATSARPGDGVGGAWRVSLARGRVSETIDPIGARTSLRYAPDGLLEGIGGATGASTQVDWRPRSVDDVPRVDRVRVVSDATDAELSTRRWSPGESTLPSGWPLIDVAHAESSTGSAYETVLSDGATSIVSAYDHRARLERRTVRGLSDSGAVELQTQRFAYPADDGTATAGAAPVAWSRPTSATVGYADASGATRSTTVSFVYDRQGRVIDETRADGSRVETRYDETVPEGAALPVGLPVAERITGADGLVAESRRELTADRSAVVATETWSSGPHDAPVLTGRIEYSVDADGFVTEQRAFAAGGPSTPIATRWRRSVDLTAGTQTLSETIAAGTSVEATSTRTTSLVHGGVLSETDPLGRTASATYDAAGRVVEQTDAAGEITRTSYTTAQRDGSNTETVTGPDRVAVTEVRDELGRVIELHDNLDRGRPADGHVRVSERRAYPAPGIVAVTDAWGATTTTTHDAFGRVIATEQPTGLVEVVSRDDVAGSATVALTPTGDPADAEHTTTQLLDDAGRPVATTGTRADGVAFPETAQRYDGLGRTVESSDGVRATTITYDEFGSPATTTFRSATGDEPAALTSRRRFDGFGRSLEKTLDAGDDESRSGGSRELDPLGRTTTETDQAGRVTRTAYTADGLVARVEHAAGSTEEYTYDPRTRALTFTRTTSPKGATIDTAIEVDPRTGEPKAMYDPADRDGTELSWTTDALGNTTALRYPDGAEIRHEYDLHGRRLATVDTAGNRTEFGYDRAGRPTGAVQRTGAGAELSRVAYEYDDLGRMHRLTRGNGVTTDYTFTSVGEIARETTTRDGEVQSDRSYEYSPSGLVLTRVDRTRGDDGALRATTTAYSYDLLDRLTRSSVHDGETVDAVETRRTEYAVTVSGDIAAETVTNRPGAADQITSRREFEYSALGELTAITTDGSRREQQFDAAGSLVRAADGTRYEYDAANRLVAVTTPDGEATRTAYWADGSRRSRTSAEGTTGFYWDGATLVNDVHADESGATVGVATYLLGAERHARSTTEAEGGATATEYTTLDRHGNVSELTDEAGAVGTSYTYSDYGVETETRRASHDEPAHGLHRNPFRYASEYTDRDGRQHLQTRLYDAQQMRFDRRDRAELHNLYAYADLNPISKVDPTGRTAWLDWANVAATGLGAALSVAGGVSAISTLLAMVTGPASLGVFGIAAVTVGLADAAFAGFQVANTLSATKWINETAATAASWTILGAGIGIAAAGILSRRLLSPGKGPTQLFGPAPDGVDDGVIESSIERLDQHQLARGRAIRNVPHIEARLDALTKLSNQVVKLEETLKLTPALSKPTTKIGKITGDLTAARAEMTNVLRINASMRARPMSPYESSDLFITPGTRARSNTAQNQALAHLTSAGDRLQRLRTELIVDHGIKPPELEDLEIELGKIISDIGKYVQKF